VCHHHEIKNKIEGNFSVWGSAGIYLEKLIFVCGGGESFKDVSIFTVLSTVLQDEEMIKILM
jgi:hypothetical protein